VGEWRGESRMTGWGVGSYKRIKEERSKNQGK
jgi:hypothetical protein